MISWVFSYQLNTRKYEAVTKIRQATNRYKKENDIYRQFQDECILKADKYISITDIYERFVVWHKMCFSKNLDLSKSDVQEYFAKIWGEPDKSKWFGYRIKTLDEEEEDESIIIIGKNNNLPPL